MFGLNFGLDKAIQSVENIATEWIQTDKEAAEAKSLFVKTLDPNGKMRREISKFTSQAYGFYLVATVGFIGMTAFGVGDVEGARVASSQMTELFVPITTAWGAIVGASFGVNGVNSFKGF
jgi:hypothetical protein